MSRWLQSPLRVVYLVSVAVVMTGVLVLIGGLVDNRTAASDDVTGR